jgi:F0F1-type ATP synthase assembly protein I
MQDRTKNKPELSEDLRRHGVLSLIMAMADTTWRMFGPPAVLVSLGLWADVSFRTKPWLTVLGLVTGLSVSVLLVRQQLRGAGS